MHEILYETPTETEVAVFIRKGTKHVFDLILMHRLQFSCMLVARRWH